MLTSRAFGAITLALSVAVATGWSSASAASPQNRSLDDPGPQVTRTRYAHNPYDLKGDELAALVAKTGALGSYLAEDGQIVVAVPASGSSTFSKSDAVDLGIPVTIETRNIELADIAQIDRMTDSVEWKPNDPGVFGPTAVYDPRFDFVEIYSDAPASVFQSVVDAYPGKIRLVGPFFVTSRIEDYEPHYGGAHIIRNGSTWDNSGCSSGFTVLNSLGNPRMVTAGHCYVDYVGATIKSTLGSSFGTVKPLDPDWPVSVDALLIGGGGISQGAHIYNGTFTSDTQYADVIGAADPVSDFYCFSGSVQHDPEDPYSIERCGLTLVQANKSGQVELAGNVYTVTFDLYRGPLNYGSCNHDSGSAFYRYMNNIDEVQIAGLEFGGSDRVPPGYVLPTNKSACDMNWQTDVLIMKWSRIRDTYEVTIKTV